MIVVALRGGLGNQLFQYAAGRSVSIHRGVPLKLDLEWYELPETRAGATPRAFELSHFNAAAERATSEEIAFARNGRDDPGVIARVKRKIGATSRSGWIRERKYFEFDQSVLDAGPAAYLDGYWQNQKYFADVADVIRDDFRLATPMRAGAKRALDRIASSPSSVGVHVRRGDYVDGTSPIHAVCDVEYFRSAIQNVSINLDDPKFFFFSDDPAWVESNLGDQFPIEHVSGNGPDAAHEDLILMSACRHQIISNSTFSWWAAWLNTYDKKVVVAPRRWFTGDEFDTSDLMPRGWRQL